MKDLIRGSTSTFRPAPMLRTEAHGRPTQAHSVGPATTGMGWAVGERGNKKRIVKVTAQGDTSHTNWVAPSSHARMPGSPVNQISCGHAVRPWYIHACQSCADSALFRFANPFRITTRCPSQESTATPSYKIPFSAIILACHCILFVRLPRGRSTASLPAKSPLPFGVAPQTRHALRQASTIPSGGSRL